MAHKISSRIWQMLSSIQIQVMITGAAITLVVAAAYIYKPDYLKLMELKLYDVLLAQSHSKAQTGSVAIVDIDEKSLEKYGQWPWPRYRVALLLQKINLAGPRAVGLDILFAEPDSTSPKIMQQALKRDLKIDIGFTNMPAGLMDNDQIMAGILDKGPYVMGYSAAFDTLGAKRKNNVTPLKAVILKSSGARPASDYLFKARDLIAPLPVFLEKAGRSGFLNTITDPDGVLRRTPLFIAWDNKIYPQLSLAALMEAFKGSMPDPVIKITRGGIESIKLGRTVIPLEANGAMLLNYRGPSRTFPYLSAGDILDDKVDRAAISGKIIFLGTSAAGLKDIRVSPLDQVFPGVEVHATMVDNVLSNDFIHRPDWMPGLELFLILSWGLITSALIGWASAALTIPLTLILGFGAWYGGVWSLDRMNIWISPFFPVMILALNFSLLNLQKFWFSEKKKKFFKSAFSKYVSKAVVNQLAENPDRLSLEGEEKEISIFFSDIRGFTSISEQLKPSQITLLLHDYFTPVTKIIIQNNGTHDKFIGDAIMCFWNAPLDVKNHESCAIAAALETIEALDDLNKGFEKKYGITIAIGIGLHVGNCRVGNMGSDDIFDYTIIGDSVNLASRLESLTKYYGLQLLVSEQMLAGIKPGQQVQEIDCVRVKGKDEPVRIFTVYADTDPSIEKQVNQYNDALALYKEMAFKQSADQFEALASAHPESKLYAIYLDRCRVFADSPPEEGWDGVFTHTSK